MSHTVTWTGHAARVNVDAGGGAAFTLAKGTPRNLPLNEAQADRLEETHSVSVVKIPDPPAVASKAETLAAAAIGKTGGGATKSDGKPEPATAKASAKKIKKATEGVSDGTR